MKTIEQTILNHLVYDEEFTRKVLPFIKEEYFQSNTDKIAYKLIDDFFTQYNTLPTKEALLIELDNNTEIQEDIFESVAMDIRGMEQPEKTDEQWLLDNTEKFCQEKAIYNGIMESIAILEDGGTTKSTGAIPELLTDALAVCFDNHIGHSYLDDSDERFEFYHQKINRLPFDLEYFNKITQDGLPDKTLNVILAGTGTGKTLAMCHMAGGHLLDGKNVLYITMEMAEERIAERIDANLLNVPLDELKIISNDMYEKKIARVRGKTAGKLIVKEYPTASAGAGHFRHLMNELKLKRNFTPDVVYVDYLNICTSMRVKNAQANSYTIIKSIAEEIRGLAVEKSVPIITATQTTRSGFCLALDTKVIVKDKGEINIVDVEVGDKILSNAGWNNIELKYPIEKRPAYKITTKSGKEIVCSGDHIFPTDDGEKSIHWGLKIGDKLASKT